MINSTRIAVSALVWLLSPVTMADTAETEIQYLLEAIGQSQCMFIRNGKTHAATEAESHLRMKYRNGKIRIDTAEQFIERVASKSSWSGEAYFIDCPDTDRGPSADWLSARLAGHRQPD